MSGFILKLIAMITMLIDHAGYILFSESPAYVLMRIIGRLAFPIYCFLLVEGFHHTRDTKKYLLRLGVFALISELFFDLAFSNMDSIHGMLSNQNIFFTLFIGLLVIYFMRFFEVTFNNVILVNLFSGFVVLVGCILAYIMRTDYNVLGILMIVSFYIFKNNKLLLFIILLILNYQMAGLIQAFSILSIILILFYNGKKGPKINKYIFYAFYPLHIAILIVIRKLLEIL